MTKRCRDHRGYTGCSVPTLGPWILHDAWHGHEIAEAASSVEVRPAFGGLLITSEIGDGILTAEGPDSHRSEVVCVGGHRAGRQGPCDQWTPSGRVSGPSRWAARRRTRARCWRRASRCGAPRCAGARC